jgi:anionic cell wall polymer biosynthesis LytR-Cps2A-Psr (LCP) family protein
VVPELNVRPVEAREPLVFLVIGSDSRARLDNLQNFGEAAGERSDVIMLIKLDPSNGHAQILSLPRDLLVEIPGHGTNRINAAYAFGGAPLMVRTVKEATGLSILSVFNRSLTRSAGSRSTSLTPPAMRIRAC